jgi:hypothetical protein
MAGARPKATPVRVDPSRRKTRAGHDQTALTGADPTKKYKWVHPDDKSDFGIRAHGFRGWTVEMTGDSSVMPQRGACSMPGEPVQMSGYVLMSIPREKFAVIEREGEFGNGGQDSLDEIEEMIAAEGGRDVPRVNRQYFDLVNETSANHRVGAEGV